MERNDFINDILNSTNGITMVAPSADLFSRIEGRIKTARNVPATTIWWVAASIAILVMINITVISSSKTTSGNQDNSAFTSTLNKSNQLY